ncbi:26S proteasome non-ATPase regulatory subunit 8 [Purpureocillium lavendulum]|uniref:26S proteasome non-ATPase regulatory subunit 8 n=1 Tax=Purpureocillium lavendulum TaxID=1247861 RepID=A0AB34FLE4_9HYPO|nr:26S proteasome non-ATPase regulatory subunit 8 [Purpureocillium lavendulum]
MPTPSNCTLPHLAFNAPHPQTTPASDTPASNTDLERVSLNPAVPLVADRSASSLSTMADGNLSQVLGQLKHSPSMSWDEASSLLSKAKLALLKLNALTPTSSVPTNLLALARETYEQGALFAIRARNPEAFTRYVQQLQPFYELPSARLPPNLPERNKVTGLSLLLLLTQGRYAEFHSELESLANRDGGGSTGDVEGDRYLGYPIRLERWLMEGSYDRVWKAMKSSEVPCDEYSVFSEILKKQIRSEIASSSERAYPSLPISSTKSLLFLDSEGDVIQFAKERGWVVRDGHIFFPDTAETSEEGAQSKDVSQMVIENTLGYARELETIV